MTYIKDKSANSSPMLQKQISMFNNISKWVIAMVLQKETPMARARLFKRFIQICRVSIHFVSRGRVGLPQKDFQFSAYYVFDTISIFISVCTRTVLK